MDEEEFDKKFGTITDGIILNRDSNYALLFMPMRIVRKLTYALIIVFLVNYQWL